MNQFDDFPPEPLRLAAYDNMQQPSPIESHLAAAIFDGLRRTLCAHDPAYMTKHDLVFLFRDSSARDNEQALRLCPLGRRLAMLNGLNRRCVSALPKMLSWISLHDGSSTRWMMPAGTKRRESSAPGAI